MDTYLRLLKYVKPHWRKLVLLLVTVVLFASLSGVSLTLIHPFLKIVLYGDEGIRGADAPRSGAGSAEGIPLPETVERLKNSAQAWFEARIYAGDAKTRLLRFCVILVILFLVKNVVGYLQTYLTVYLEQQVLSRVRNEVYGHIQKLPMSYFSKEKAGHIISRLTNDVSMLQGAVIGVAASVVRNGFMTLTGLLVVLVVSWKLSVLTLIVRSDQLVLVELDRAQAQEAELPDPGGNGGDDRGYRREHLGDPRSQGVQHGRPREAPFREAEPRGTSSSTSR